MNYDDVEFGVDIDESSLGIDDGQGGNAPFDELFEGDDDGRVRMGRFHVVVRPDPQLSQCFVHVTGFWHFVHLQISSFRSSLP